MSPYFQNSKKVCQKSAMLQEKWSPYFPWPCFLVTVVGQKVKMPPPPPREVLRPISESSTQLFKKTRRFSAGFLRLGKFFSAYVLKIRFICVQNVMYVMLATP